MSDVLEVSVELEPSPVVIRIKMSRESAKVLRLVLEEYVQAGDSGGSPRVALKEIARQIGVLV